MLEHSTATGVDRWLNITQACQQSVESPGGLERQAGDWPVAVYRDRRG